MLFSTTLYSICLWRAASRAFLATTLFVLPAAGDARCMLAAEFERIEYASFLVTANERDDLFVGQLKNAFYELAHRRPKDSKRPRNYVVTRVTAPPGFGKSSLLNYIEQLLAKEDEDGGDCPERIRDMLRFDVRFPSHRTIRFDRTRGVVRLHIYDRDCSLVPVSELSAGDMLAKFIEPFMEGKEIPDRSQTTTILEELRNRNRGLGLDDSFRLQFSRKPYGAIHFDKGTHGVVVQVYDWDGTAWPEISCPANGSFAKQLERFMSCTAKPSRREKRAIIETVKGFVKEKKREQLTPFPYKDHFCVIRLDQLAKQFQIRSTMLDELKNDNGPPTLAFAKLRAFDYDDYAAPGIDFLVTAFSPDLLHKNLTRLILIVDSIDEIHPASAKSLLERIDEYVEDRENKDQRTGFLRVFIVGRPEGFTEYYRITQGGAYKTEPVELRPPRFSTRAQTRAAAQSVARYVLGIKTPDSFQRRGDSLGKKPKGPYIELVPNAFGLGVQRSDLDRVVDTILFFLKEDPRLLEFVNRFGLGVQMSDVERVVDKTFHSIIELVDQFGLGVQMSGVDRMVDNALRFLTAHPWLNGSIYNLDAFNQVMKVANELSAVKRNDMAILSSDDDYKLKEIFFQSLIGRARASHHRPALQTEKYLELLEEIACKYPPGRRGDFFVPPGDAVTIAIDVCGERCSLSYLVESVLNRSGVATLEPVNLYVPRYRFYPEWVHCHLIKRRGLRVGGKLRVPTFLRGIRSAVRSLFLSDCGDE